MIEDVQNIQERIHLVATIVRREEQEETQAEQKRAPETENCPA